MKAACKITVCFKVSIGIRHRRAICEETCILHMILKLRENLSFGPSELSKRRILSVAPRSTSHIQQISRHLSHDAINLQENATDWLKILKLIYYRRHNLHQ